MNEKKRREQRKAERSTEIRGRAKKMRRVAEKHKEGGEVESGEKTSSTKKVRAALLFLVNSALSPLPDLNLITYRSKIEYSQSIPVC
jgi:hypothetical protein